MAVAGACSSTPSSSGGGSRGAYKIGTPYSIDGVTYTPTEEFQHVESGMASWYGPGFHGKATANGERYDQNDRTAAHRTLQMPSMIRVTNLDNGNSVVVRVNDRGPFSRNRVLDLSRAAANDLDMVKSGVVRIRIEQLGAESQAVKDVALNGGGPLEQREALERLAAGRSSGSAPVMTASGQAAGPPVTVPATVQAAWPENPRSPAVTTVQASGSAGAAPTIATIASATVASPLAPTGGFYVQTGAFAAQQNAERQRGAVSSYGLSEIFQAAAAGRDVYRVRLGPYTTADAAGIVAERLKRSGFGDARVVSD